MPGILQSSRTRNAWTAAAAVVAAALAFLLIRSVGSRMSALGMGADNEGARAALDGASRFHDAVSSGKAEKICKSVSPSAFENMTGFPCTQFVVYLHGKLGKVKGSKSAQPPLVQPARVILDEVTGYERGDAQEHFEYSINGGDAVLINYRIQSEALNH